MNAAEHLLGAAALARHAERIALACGDQTLTYAELAAQVRRAAGALEELGVAPGDRVLLLMRDTPELAVAWLGCVWRGAVALALNSQLSEDDFHHVRSDSGARLAIVEDAYAAALPGFVAALARERRIAIAGATGDGIPGWREALARAAPDAACFAAGPEDAAFWLYSSGTTGRPKGIIHRHKDIVPAGQVLREVIALEPGDKVVVTSRLFFAYGLENGLLGPLSVGATAVLDPDWTDTERVCRLVALHRPKAFFSVPSYYRRLLALGEQALAPFRAVRHFFAAGERLPESMAEQWQRRVGGEILSIYGMSETFCVAMVTPPGSSGGRHTGKPLRGVEARLLTLEGREAARGEPGVLWLRHPALALGYANRSEQTREQFRDGWFCTKDVFVRDADGYYAHQGRADELIKVAGQWVKPSEVEEAVLGEAEIAEAACVPVRDADGFERLALFVAASGDPQAAVGAAERACAARLARHKQPKWVRAVQGLPRTATGKVQRFRLREMLEREGGAKG
ncbi:MAG: AMP-binding protein [Betaproteobacteria bacterium]|nr:AMP-binding protein [Betaproteobacteria bacterium]